MQLFTLDHVCHALLLYVYKLNNLHNRLLNERPPGMTGKFRLDQIPGMSTHAFLFQLSSPFSASCTPFAPSFRS